MITLEEMRRRAAWTCGSRKETRLREALVGALALVPTDIPEGTYETVLNRIGLGRSHSTGSIYLHLMFTITHGEFTHRVIYQFLAIQLDTIAQAYHERGFAFTKEVLDTLSVSGPDKDGWRGWGWVVEELMIRQLRCRVSLRRYKGFECCTVEEVY